MLREEFTETRELKVADYGFPLVRVFDLAGVEEGLVEKICARADDVFRAVMTTNVSH